MSCFTTMSAVTAPSKLDLTKHVNYTAGMILGVDDFTQEFTYLSGRDRWLAREALGYGTVSGLRVRTDEDKNDFRVMVEPGVAISPRGQLICVPAAQCAYLNKWLAAAKPEELHKKLQPVYTSPPDVTSPPAGNEVTLYVVLCYRDCPTDDVPIPGEPCRSESELKAASRIKDDFSLELRLEAPKQPEEEAVRKYSDFLKKIEISDDAASTQVDDFLDALRAEFLPNRQPTRAPLQSPPVTSPPTALHIRPEDVSKYIRLAFRLWVTELRNVMTDKAQGCAAETTGEKKLEDCVLLAELHVPLEFISPGWKVSETGKVETNEENRPFLVHLRMLQEWMLNEPNDHGALTGLEDDDHPQYLLIDGTRAMTGHLNLDRHKIINLAKGTSAGDAVPYEQAIKVGDTAAGDLTGTYPEPTIAKLQGKEVDATEPEDNAVLFWNGDAWVPKVLKESTSEVKPSMILPLATISQMSAGKFEIWFNIDAPDNLAAIEAEKDFLQIFYETDASQTVDPFLTSLTLGAVSSVFRNVFTVSFDHPGNRNFDYMRFRFDLSKLFVRIKDDRERTPLLAYAGRKNIKYIGYEQGLSEWATIFVRYLRNLIPR